MDPLVPTHLSKVNTIAQQSMLGGEHRRRETVNIEYLPQALLQMNSHIVQGSTVIIMYKLWSCISLYIQEYINT